MEEIPLVEGDTVAEYKAAFEQLVYSIRLYDKTISEPFLISQFILGLKEELRAAVEIQLPDTVTRAATLAAIQEGLLLRRRHLTSFHRPNTLQWANLILLHLLQLVNSGKLDN